MSNFLRYCILANAALGLTATAHAAPADHYDYELVRDVEAGAPAFWDYLTYDGGRLYAAHVDQVTVMDAATGKIVGQVGPFHDAHGIAILPRRGKGYADSGEDGSMKVFDLKTLKIVKEIKIPEDADGVVYDTHNDRVLVVSGDGNSVTTIDPATDEVVKTIALPGKPEFLAVDDHGFAYVNIADKSLIARVDVAKGVVTASWPLANCKSPHGIAYNAKTNTLFTGCANSRMIVVDAATGRNLADLPIGPQSDAVVIDSIRGRAFSANGTGTISVVALSGAKYSVVRTMPSFFGGRNMAIDPATGALFLAHGHMKIVGPAKPLDLRFAWEGLDLATFKPN